MDELALVKDQMTEQARRWFDHEAAIKEAMKVAQKAEEAANKRLHEAGQKYAELLAKVMPLHAEIAELKDAADASKSRTKNLEVCCASQEVSLGKVEAVLTAKSEAYDLMKAELSKKARLKPWRPRKKKWFPKLSVLRRLRKSSSTMPRVPLLKGSQRPCPKWRANT